VTAVELTSRFHEYRNAESLAQAQEIPPKFLQTILTQLRRAGIVSSRRGIDGGYRLALPPEEIRLIDIFRAVGAPASTVYRVPSGEPGDTGAKDSMGKLYALLNNAVIAVLENVTLADIVVVEGES
jgi:Rrf2 family protein